MNNVDTVRAEQLSRNRSMAEENLDQIEKRIPLIRSYLEKDDLQLSESITINRATQAGKFSVNMYNLDGSKEGVPIASGYNSDLAQKDCRETASLITGKKYTGTTKGLSFMTSAQYNALESCFKDMAVAKLGMNEEERLSFEKSMTKAMSKLFTS
tara:strand:- start:438 stop:902 length:465 start_codon:yes stop_codon:yes gene_type:complete